MNIIEVNYKWNGGLSTRPRTTYIALHHSESTTATPQQVDSWHKSNGWSGIGYHFLVRKDGSIYRGRPLNSMGAHVSGMNSCSLGICAEGRYTYETMPWAQKKAICELLVYLKGIYPNAQIVGHREIGSSDCPGNNYPLWDIKTNYRTYAGSNGNNVEEDIDMGRYEELVGKINAQNAEIAALRQEVKNLQSEFIYNYVDDNMPDWARPIIHALCDAKVILGVNDAGDLGLKFSDLRNYVTGYRGGAYDEALQVKRNEKGQIVSSPMVEKYDK